MHIQRKSGYGRITLPQVSPTYNSIAVRKVVYDDAAEIPQADPSVPAGSISEIEVEAELVSLGGQEAQDEWAKIQTQHAAGKKCGVDHVSKVVHTLTLADIRDSQERSSLAFDGLTYRDSVRGIEYSPSERPIMLVLHEIVEDMGRIPTWDEFIARMHKGGDLAYVWWDGIVDKFGDSERLEKASRHRLGTFYYAFIRELHLAAYLRETHNIHLRSHPIADFGLKADFWVGNIVLSVYLSSTQFRTDYASAKVTSKSKFEGSHFHHIEARMRAKVGDYSNVGCFFFTPKALDALAAEVRTILNTAKE